MAESPENITALLVAWEHGDQSALERLMPIVEKELRCIAKSHMRKERGRHLLQTTALVNEAYIKLVDQKRVHWQNRTHFFAIAATCMRRALLDHIRAENRVPASDIANRIPLSDAPPISVERSSELLAFDDALRKLAIQDLRKSQVIEMQYFGGYSVEEIAKLQKV